MKLQRLIALFLLIASLLPVYYLNKWLQQWIAPKKSFARFLLYMLTGFALAFLYTFVVTWLILKIFPFRKT